MKFRKPHEQVRVRPSGISLSASRVMNGQKKGMIDGRNCFGRESEKDL